MIMQAAEWITIAQQLGFPVVVLIAVSLGLWRSARWFASKIIEPLVPASVAYIRAAEKGQEVYAQLLAQIVDNQLAIARNQAAIAGKIGAKLPRSGERGASEL